MIDKIRVIVIRPNSPPAVEYVGTTLKDAQAVVDGDIEDIYMGASLFLRCNQEGKIRNLLPSVYVSRIRDTVRGICYLLRMDSDGCDSDVLDEDIQRYITDVK